MPTTTIDTPLHDPGFERRVAKNLSLWWRRRGTDINHVMTRFRTVAGDRIFSGPYPLGREDLPFALVTCVVSMERDAGFKRDYARQLRAALGPVIPADRVFVSFRPTDPADHFAPDSPLWTQE